MSNLESYLRLPLEKFSGWGRGGGGETIEDPNEEEKIGDGINGGKPLEDNGNGRYSRRVLSQYQFDQVLYFDLSTCCMLIFLTNPAKECH